MLWWQSGDQCKQIAKHLSKSFLKLQKPTTHISNTISSPNRELLYNHGLGLDISTLDKAYGIKCGGIGYMLHAAQLGINLKKTIIAASSNNL
jgi:hypothetical protein